MKPLLGEHWPEGDLVVTGESADDSLMAAVSIAPEVPIERGG
jgi:hypothetical protein